MSCKITGCFIKKSSLFWLVALPYYKPLLTLLYPLLVEGLIYTGHSARQLMALFFATFPLSTPHLMNSMKLFILLKFISWKKTPNDAVIPQCHNQFTPKMKANAVPRLLSSSAWIDQYNQCNVMTSFMEFMRYYDSALWEGFVRLIRHILHRMFHGESQWSIRIHITGWASSPTSYQDETTVTSPYFMHNSWAGFDQVNFH